MGVENEHLCNLQYHMHSFFSACCMRCVLSVFNRLLEILMHATFLNIPQHCHIGSRSAQRAIICHHPKQAKFHPNKNFKCDMHDSIQECSHLRQGQKSVMNLVDTNTCTNSASKTLQVWNKYNVIFLEIVLGLVRKTRVSKEAE